jgi:outer membrane lipopolysaccharide assembly protein LptE/RlpB
MKKHTLILVALLALTLGLSACGQRVQPKEPEGKINPSLQY